MVFPIIIDNITVGTAHTENDGLYTVYDCRFDGNSAVKLYVCGGGASAYLGVAIPENGVMHLRKRLTRLDMSKFPSIIEYISDRMSEPAAEPVVEHEPQEEPVQQAEPVPEPEPASDTQTEPPQEDDLLWYSYPDGTLTAFDGKSRYLAMPQESANSAKGIQRTIEGKKYLVFPAQKR